MANHFHYFGGFFYLWASYDCLLEIICQRTLGISPRQAHIIFASLGAKPKQEIAISLLKEGANNEPLIKKLRSVPNIARRNHITHSLYLGDDKLTEHIFRKRDIQSGLKTRDLVLDSVGMKKHFEKLLTAIIEAQQLAGVDDEDLQSYCDAVKPPKQ